MFFRIFFMGIIVPVMSSYTMNLDLEKGYYSDSYSNQGNQEKNDQLEVNKREIILGRSIDTLAMHYMQKDYDKNEKEIIELELIMPRLLNIEEDIEDIGRAVVVPRRSMRDMRMQVMLANRYNRLSDNLVRIGHDIESNSGLNFKDAMAEGKHSSCDKKKIKAACCILFLLTGVVTLIVLS